MNMRTVPQTTSTPIADLLFIDPQVEDSETLLAGIEPSIDVVRLKPGSEPLKQIALAVSARDNIGTVHILSHGEPGGLLLAGHKIDETSLSKNPSAVMAIKSALGESAKLAL